MTRKNKILLSTITTLVLLLNGCTDGGTEADGGDATNPVPPIAVTPDPVIPEPIEPKPPVAPYITAGWYGKTKVTLDANGKIYTHNTAGVFGELVQSEEGKDLHDIPNYGPSTFQIVFPQTEWGDDNGDYFSNYQKYADGFKTETGGKFGLPPQ